MEAMIYLNIKTLAIIAEDVPEQQIRDIIKVAESKNIGLIGPALLGTQMGFTRVWRLVAIDIQGTGSLITFCVTKTMLASRCWFFLARLEVKTNMI